MTARAVFRPGRLAATAIFLISALSGQSIFGHEIQIVEYSSKNLSVTWDGSSTGITVINTAPDQWTVTGLSFFPPGRPPFVAWREPENRFFNVVTFFGETARSISIISDGTPNNDFFNRVPDGTRWPVGLVPI